MVEAWGYGKMIPVDVEDDLPKARALERNQREVELLCLKAEVA